MDDQGDAEMDACPAQHALSPIAPLAESTNMAPQSSQNSTGSRSHNLRSLIEGMGTDQRQKENEPPAKTPLTNSVPSSVMVIDISSDDDAIMAKPSQGARQRPTIAKALTKAQKKARNRLAQQQQQKQSQHRGMTLRSATAVTSQKPLPASPPIRSHLEISASQQREIQRNQKSSFEAYRNASAAGYLCYLPFATQHSILQSIQNLLEECLFEFAKARVPHVLTAARWHTHHAGELNLWWPVFRNVMNALPKEAIDHSQLDSSIGNLFDRIKHIRHITVHRIQEMPMSSVEWMTKDAASLALALGDNDRGSRLLELYKRVKDVCERAQAALEPTVVRRGQLKVGEEEIRTLEAQRAQIDQRLAVLREEQLRFLDVREGTEQIGDELLGPLKDLDSFMVYWRLSWDNCLETDTFDRSEFKTVIIVQR
ncbi:uncharacterized protein RAG0_06005 [Rhynchosporium agropyri]|uniref:Ubiquinol-cytochrome-c reductase cytochrome c1 n=1 Tax=Rhynchosporium agropyri TaxID=914238 RepID=A0A1E1KFJ5_9HELO|nr:uncharacterized protein RAG0_06005 [Rhynchosporium agropyri]